jgi:N-methylhydantoinase A
LEVPALAEGILAVANAKMANAIRALTVERGIDPREFSLVAFGGAGPMHAVFLAEELQIPEVVVPYSPGTFSAWGMLHTDIRHDIVQTFYQAVSETATEQLESTFAQMETKGGDILAAEGVAAEARQFVRTADMRYVGQEYFVNIPLPDVVNDDTLESLPDRFHEAYYERYGHSNPEEAVEFVNLRVSAVGLLTKGRAEPTTSVPDSPAQPRRSRQVVFEQQAYKTAVYYRSDLQPGHRFEGPAIVEELTCTTVVPPGHGVTIDGYGNMIITVVENQGFSA